LAPPSIKAVSQTLPEHYWPQEELIAYFTRLWEKKYYNVGRLEDLHRSVQVKGRYMAVPASELDTLETFAKRNNAFIRCATDIGERAIRDVLKQANLTPQDIDHIFFVTITGLATLELPATALARTWKSLNEVGNLSSASVLFVLSEMLKTSEAKPGDYGLMAAMGPGFCAELVLLQW
jgi:predicted naringenin-chalcone synthase